MGQPLDAWLLFCQRKGNGDVSAPQVAAQIGDVAVQLAQTGIASGVAAIEQDNLIAAVQDKISGCGGSLLVTLWKRLCFLL